jgi:hypothetical protein
VDEIVYGYKLVRKDRYEELHPLFINRSQVLTPGVWYTAEEHLTPGFAYRPGWHATTKPEAPHLKEILKSGEHRVWVQVALRDVTEYARPESQGGTWLLAKQLMIMEA